MVFFVYILECADGTLYAGWTKNLKKRVHAHNHLKSGARYTRARRPVKLVYAESFKTSGAARKREYALKQLTRKDKIRIVKMARG